MLRAHRTCAEMTGPPAPSRACRPSPSTPDGVYACRPASGAWRSRWMAALAGKPGTAQPAGRSVHSALKPGRGPGAGPGARRVPAPRATLLAADAAPLRGCTGGQGCPGGHGTGEAGVRGEGVDRQGNPAPHPRPPLGRRRRRGLQLVGNMRTPLCLTCSSLPVILYCVWMLCGPSDPGW